MPEGPALSYSLVIPTKDRSYHLSRRLPYWAGMGCDEVVVVDSSQDRRHRDANERLCQCLRVQYVYARANRSEARNLGARLAKGTWVLFFDDDVPGSSRFNRKVMDAHAVNHDWLKERASDEVTVFNRDFFLEVGGYRPNLVLGEDEDLTARAVAQGKGGSLEGVFGVVDFSPNVRESTLDFTRRLSNYIEYSVTLWEYARQSERPARTVFSWCLTILRVGRRALRGDMTAVPCFLGAVGGLVFGLALMPLRQRIHPGKAGSGHKA